MPRDIRYNFPKIRNLRKSTNNKNKENNLQNKKTKKGKNLLYTL